MVELHKLKKFRTRLKEECIDSVSNVWEGTSNLGKPISGTMYTIPSPHQIQGIVSENVAQAGHTFVSEP
jgi:hypothetical protein